MSLDSNSQVVEGVQIPGKIPSDVFRAALNYKPRPDDLFLVTFPKCGTTWTGHILLLLLQKGEPLTFTSPLDVFFRFPYLDMSGPAFVENMPRPGPIKTHLPLNKAPWSTEAKYIYLTRNPKDCAVSYFHHMKNVPWHRYQGSFDDFFEDFIAGNTDYGDYFDHLLSGYARRNDPNVLFITYEELKDEFDKAILKIASFIDDEKYAEPLRKDPNITKNIKEYSSLKVMSEFFSKTFEGFVTMKPEDLFNLEVPEALKSVFKDLLSVFQNPDVAPTFAQDATQFFRKGVTGDWKNFFTEDQSRRLDEKFAERTKGTDIPNLWKNYM